MSAPHLLPLRQRRRRARLYFIGGLLVLGAISLALVLQAFRDNIVFFYGPSELLDQPALVSQTVRVGGLVKRGSIVAHETRAGARFIVTDTRSDLPVEFFGILPDLFREGQGVVALGRLGSDEVFRAQEILAKHDETYMPAEVVEAIKRAGTWKSADDE